MILSSLRCGDRIQEVKEVQWPEQVDLEGFETRFHLDQQRILVGVQGRDEYGVTSIEKSFVGAQIHSFEFERRNNTLGSASNHGRNERGESTL